MEYYDRGIQCKKGGIRHHLGMCSECEHINNCAERFPTVPTFKKFSSLKKRQEKRKLEDTPENHDETWEDTDILSICQYVKEEENLDELAEELGRTLEAVEIIEKIYEELKEGKIFLEDIESFWGPKRVRQVKMSSTEVHKCYN